MKSASLVLIFDFPLTLTHYSIFDVGTDKSYVDWNATNKKFREEYKQFIKSELKALIDQCQKKDQKLSAYFSGHFIKLLESIDAAVLNTLCKIVASGHLEILGGTYNHSLSSVHTWDLFKYEVSTHIDLMKKTFKTKPVRFYNTENIFFNQLSSTLIKLGFHSVFAGVIEWYVGNTNDRVFQDKGNKKFSILLVDADEGKSLVEQTAQTAHFVQLDLCQMKKHNGVANIINNVKKKAEISDLSSVIKKQKPNKSYLVKSPIMGSVSGRSLFSYDGHAMQANTIKQYYRLSEKVLKSKNEDLQMTYLDLGKAINFLGLSASSETHGPTPYDKYSWFINILSDLEIRVEA